MTDSFSNFTREFPPSDNLTKPSEETIKKYQKNLPKELLDFWKEYGFGDYGDGIVKVINPSDYENVTGINKDCDIPLLADSFGDIFLLRLIPEKKLKAIGILNMHFRNREFFIVDENCVEEFFGGIEASMPILRADLFGEAIKKCGKLAPDEIYFFTPALAMGGAEKIDFVEKGKAFVHYDVLAQMLGEDFSAAY